MENLEIISTISAVQGLQIVGENTINYAWSHSINEGPKSINFNVIRGIKGSETFTGNVAISGAYYVDSKKFDVQNNRFLTGDFELYQQILNSCENISLESSEI